MDVRAEGQAIAFAAFTDWEGIRRSLSALAKPARLASIEALSIVTVSCVGSVQNARHEWP